MIVLTADQKRSTRHGDRVPEALAALADLAVAGLAGAARDEDGAGVALPVERTLGDAIQGLR